MPRSADRTRLHRSAAVRTLAASMAGALLVGALSGCAQSPKPFDPLAPSDAPEQVLRTLRLAGVEHAVVGEDRGTAVVRLQVPSVASAGDVEIAWQLAATALAEAYPRSRTYAVQLFGPGALPLVEYTVRGRKARWAIEQDDAEALRAEADVRYLFDEFPPAVDMRDAVPPGATSLPHNALATGTDVTGTYLESKNRAAITMGDDGSVFESAWEAVEFTRSEVPGRAAPGPDEDTGIVLARRIAAALDAPGSARVENTAPLSRFVDSTGPGADPERVLVLRTMLGAAEAVSAEESFGSVIAVTRDVIGSVVKVRPPEQDAGGVRGALADAILVAAQSPDARANAKVVTRFTPADEIDLDDSDLSIPADVLATVARDAASDGGPPAVSWETTGGVRQQVAPATWLPYLRGDGRVFWLAGEDGPVALTNASVDGWAWSARRAHVVDAQDVGRVLSSIELR